MGNGVNVQVVSIARKWAGVWGNKQKLDSGYECSQVSRELKEQNITLTVEDRRALREMGYVEIAGTRKIPKKSSDFVFYDEHGPQIGHINGGQSYWLCTKITGGRIGELIEQDPSGKFLTREVKKGKDGNVTTEKVPISLIKEL